MIILAYSVCDKEKSTDGTDDGVNRGIGPIKSVSLAEIDPESVSRGESVFEIKCTSCHKIMERYIGPKLLGITERRSPEWIMNMIMNPEQMTQEDPIAQELFLEYSSQMVSQDITEEEARDLLEYFRNNDAQ